MDPDINLQMPPPMAPSYSANNVVQASVVPERMMPATASASPLMEAREKPPLSSQARQTLKAQGYTDGLIDALDQNRKAFARSIWIVDNSGSTATEDGQRIVENNSKNLKFVRSTRWAELQQTVDYHIQLANLLQAPTTFRMLNDPGRIAGPKIFSLDNFTDEELAVATNTILNSQPMGVTPLTQHILEIKTQVQAMEPQLRATGERICLVIATDGTPTNERGYDDAHIQKAFTDALDSLYGLPVWVVVRLCTDNEQTVQYWNNLDNNLELNLEVLDDFVSEAQEVHEHNPYLNYGLPLHRMRELGFHHRVMDHLDEKKLATDDLKTLLRLVLGNKVLQAPDPGDSFKNFGNAIDKIVRSHGKTWNPMSKRQDFWVDVKAMNKAYGAGGWFW